MGHKAYAPRWFLPATSAAFKNNYDEIFKKKPKRPSKETRTKAQESDQGVERQGVGAEPGQAAG